MDQTFGHDQICGQRLNLQVRTVRHPSGWPFRVCMLPDSDGIVRYIGSQLNLDRYSLHA